MGGPSRTRISKGSSSSCILASRTAPTFAPRCVACVCSSQVIEHLLHESSRTNPNGQTKQELVKVGRILDTLDKERGMPPVRPVFISVDPDRDNVAQLRNYAQGAFLVLVCMYVRLCVCVDQGREGEGFLEAAAFFISRCLTSYIYRRLPPPYPVPDGDAGAAGQGH